MSVWQHLGTYLNGTTTPESELVRKANFRSKQETAAEKQAEKLKAQREAYRRAFLDKLQVKSQLQQDSKDRSLRQARARWREKRKADAARQKEEKEALPVPVPPWTLDAISPQGTPDASPSGQRAQQISSTLRLVREKEWELIGQDLATPSSSPLPARARPISDGSRLLVDTSSSRPPKQNPNHRASRGRRSSMSAMPHRATPFIPVPMHAAAIRSSSTPAARPTEMWKGDAEGTGRGAREEGFSSPVGMRAGVQRL